VSERFRIGPEIVHETVDGEVIAIDLGNGSYYSLSGSGPDAWELFGVGAGEAEIASGFVARFEVEPEVAARDAATLLGQLREHGLIAEDVEPPVQTAIVKVAEGQRRPYEPPRLERYNDMKDYFLLDPIHEVNPEAGWPQPAAD
jgi:hypothetical protein